jgi:hypothetical protein
MNILKFLRAPQNPSEDTKVPAGIWLAIPDVEEADRNFRGSVCILTTLHLF